MKTMLLSLILFSTSTFANIYSNYILSFSGGTACAIDDDGLKCWATGNAKHVIEIPEFKNPTEVYVNNWQGCAIDEGQVKCWPESYHELHGSNPGERKLLPTPVLKNPRKIVVLGYQRSAKACAIDDDGLKCWWIYESSDPRWEGEKSSAPQGQKPQSLFISDYYKGSCVVYEKETRCSTRGYMPQLKNTKQIVFGHSYVCALDDEGVKCWHDDKFTSEKMTPPELKNPHLLLAYPQTACAMTYAGAIQCWGKDKELYQSSPRLFGPKMILTGIGNYYPAACALDDVRVSCWQYQGNKVVSLHVPELHFYNPKLEFLNDYFEMLAERSTSVRSKYFSMLKDIKQNPYLALVLSSPAILSSDSIVFIESLIPSFHRGLNKINRSLGYKDLTDGLDKAADNIENRQIALRAIQAALTVALDFVSIQEKVELQDLLRQIGQLMIDPSNTSQIKNLIMKLESPTSPLQKLTSPKSAFLIDVINLAKDWLKRVK